MRNIITVLGVFLLVGAVVLIITNDSNPQEELSDNTEEETEETESTVGEEVQEEENGLNFSNATYRIEGEAINLVDGEYSAEISSDGVEMSVYAELIDTAEGDLNNDGKPDGAVVIMHDPGGTAVFYYLVGLLQTDSGGESTNAVRLGDRIGIESIEIDNEGMVEVDLLVRAEDDPFAVEPSVEETRRFRVESDSLFEVE